MNHQLLPGAWHTPTRRTQAKHRTHEQLLEAGRRMFDERGYEAATVRDVAQAVGMSTGAVFANFTDKAALFIDVINADCERLNQVLGATDLSGCSTRQALERLTGVAQDHYANQLGLLHAAISFVWRSDIDAERRALHGLKLIKQRLAGVLYRGVETGDLVFPIDVPLISDMLLDSFLASYKRMIFGGLRKAELRALQITQIGVLLAAYTANAA